MGQRRVEHDRRAAPRHSHAFANSTDVGGFGGAEFVIAGLNVTVPAQPTGRLHDVSFGLRIVQTTPPSVDSVMYVSLRQGTTTAGALISTMFLPFVDNASPSGRDIVGITYPTGLLPGQTYCLTTGGDGAGRYTVKAGAMVRALRRQLNGGLL